MHYKVFDVFMLFVFMVLFVLSYMFGFLDRFIENGMTLAFGVVMLFLFIGVCLSIYSEYLKIFRDWVFWSEVIVMLGLLGTVMGIAQSLASLDFKSIVVGYGIDSLEAFKKSLVFGMDTTIIGIFLVVFLFIIYAFRGLFYEEGE